MSTEVTRERLENDLYKIRKRLKSWEAEFLDKHGKKPGQVDINESPQDIKELYKKYTSVKRQIAKSTVKKPDRKCDSSHRQNQDTINSKDNEGDGDPWGTEFCKKTKTAAKSQFNDETGEKDSPNKEDNAGEDSGNAMLSISKKIMERSKFSTKKPSGLKRWKEEQEILKPAVKEDLLNIQEPSSTFKADQADSLDQDVTWYNEDVSNDTDFDVVSASESSNTALKDSGNQMHTSLYKAPKDTITPKDKTFKRLPAPRNNVIEPLITNKDNIGFKRRTAAFQKALQKIESAGDGIVGVTRKPDDTSVITTSGYNNVCDDDGKPRLQNDENTPSIPNSAENDRSEFDFEPKVENDIIKVASWRSQEHKRKASTDNTKPTKRCRKNTEGHTGGTSPPNPINEDIPEELHGTEDGSDKEQIGKEVVQRVKKKASVKAVSNDNFVRLNMKVKRYRRKGQATSGPAYKRMQWKQKMQARSESYGTKCFKCGQEGHWAKKCRAAPQKRGFGKKEAPIDSGKVDPVKEEDFPSLREAMNMAKGIKSTATEKDQSDNKDPETENGLDEELEVIRAGYEEPESLPPSQPLYQANTDGSLPDVPTEVYQGLRLFGHTSFRPGQEKAVMRILCGLSTLVVLSTGAGKSLCYQLPAYLYAQRSKCITLVISPLVSLMEDQVAGLPVGIKGACLHTNMSQIQRSKVIDAVSEGNVHFLLLSPEALVGGVAAGSIQGLMSKLPPIAFTCIDEAHCVSEWSHHFRPSYLRLCKVLKERLGVRCMLGLTATATMVTAASVSQHLGISDYKKATIRDSPVPNNLYLSASKDGNKEEALMTLLQGDRFSACHSIIVYCTRRDQTQRIATLIRTCLKDVAPSQELVEMVAKSTTVKKGKGSKGKVRPTWDAECYHAGLSAAQRRRVQNAFMSGRLRVVVATVAFGMGLDKSDVRGIIHFDLPKSFESYVQEIGRAGRDGQPSHCHVFLDPLGQDMNELKRHIHANTIDRFNVKKLVKKVFPRCRCKEIHEKLSDEVLEYDSNTKRCDRVCPGHQRAIPIEATVQDLDIKEEGISTLLCYLELHPKEWLVNLPSTYCTCTIQCYGGPRQLQDIAKKCPPVGVAIARDKRRGVSYSTNSNVEFPVVTVSDSMGWDVAPVKKELKLLQWDFDNTGNTGPRRSGVIVEFGELGFHFRGVGDLTDDEMDSVLAFLVDRIQMQERTELYQLQNFYDTLDSVAHKHVWLCSEEVDMKRSEKLKTSILKYFDQQPHFEAGQVTLLSFSRELDVQRINVLDEQLICDNEDQVRSDIRCFIQTYRAEHSLSGRAIARIFHGIGSPCFPNEIWGRVRRFWRIHLDIDFNLIYKMATQELVRFR